MRQKIVPPSSFAKPRCGRSPTGAVEFTSGPTVSEYAVKWLESLQEGPTRDRYEINWRVNVAPELGAKQFGAITAKELRAFVEHLDRRVLQGGLAHSTARGVWVIVRLIFKNTVSSKIEAFRIRSNNPTDGVKGPEPSKICQDKQWLYPSEFSQGIACEDISLKIRVAIVFLALTGLRINEARGLRLRDVDITRGVIHVTKQFDPKTGGTRPTKGRRTRHIPIEESLPPLLAARAAEGKPEDLVFAIPLEISRRLRDALKTAGITRPELFETTATNLQARGHDLRASYGTWLALRGDPPLVIQRRLGHANFAETEGYLRTAELFVGSSETPFPALPSSIVPMVPGMVPGTKPTVMEPLENGSNVGHRENSPFLASNERFRPPFPSSRRPHNSTHAAELHPNGPRGRRVPDRRDIRVTVKEVSGAGTIKDGRLQAPVGDAWTEVFFALQGPADERVRVEIHHADNIEAKTEYCGNGGFRDGRGLVTKNLDALEAAEVTARTKAKGAAAARDTVLAIVHSDLDGLRHYVQTLFTTPAVYLALDRRTRRPGWRG